MVEWIVWGALQKMREDIAGNVPNDELWQLFAECFAISASGRFLAMERLQPLTSASQLRMSLYPDWLNDKKGSAFGTSKTDGRIKVMDYGGVNFYAVLNPKNRGWS
jgi:hypothetical protein